MLERVSLIDTIQKQVIITRATAKTLQEISCGVFFLAMEPDF